MIETPARRATRSASSPTPLRSGPASTVNSRHPAIKSRNAPARYPAIIGSEAQHWELVQRIVSSKRFARSILLADFLLFVTHRSLTGRAAEINEQQIGVHVFGRAEQFNRSDDNIVRTYARMLRKRLEEYFRDEGPNESLHVTIPRGSYVPIFSPFLPSTPEPETIERTLDEPAVPLMVVPSPRSTAVTPLFVLIAVVGLTLALTAGFALARLLSPQWLDTHTSSGRISHRLWAQIFESNRDTYLVPADGGLVMLQSFLPRHVNLNDYANGTYRSPDNIREGLLSLASGHTVAVPLPAADLPSLVHKVEVLGARRYTSVVDLELTAQLSRLPEVIPQRLMIRYARDLRMDDLRTSNLVLLGSADSNPWVDIFQAQLNFQFTFGAAYGGSPVIVNRHPLPGERATYGSEDSETAHRSYGVIAYLPNLGMAGSTRTANGEEAGHVILIEGINMAGTQAAGAFVLNPEQMRPVLERATDSNGILHPFEVLLDTSNIAANSARAHVMGERILPN